MDLDEIYAAQDRWQSALDNAQARRERALVRIQQCHRHLGVYRMVEQIAAALRTHFLDYDLEVLGPFGLTHETSIHANDPTIEGRGCKAVGSLTFRPDDNRLVLVDRRHVTKEFPPGSLGEINGMNYVGVPLPPDGLDGLIRLLAADIAEGVQRDREEASNGT